MCADKKKFGLEIEIMRVTKDGKLAQTPHPFPNDPQLERDFCENQLELITLPCATIDLMLENLAALQQRAKKGLNGEMLWPYSCPPGFDSQDSINIAEYVGEESYRTEYRKALCKKYGKKQMLYSGIHFNFSFDGTQLKALRADNPQAKNNLYIKLAKYCMRYSWLLVLLTAASPVADPSFTDGVNTRDYASLRQSSKGYYNKFVPVLDYSSVESYADSIEELVQSGQLISPAELYIPVRLKPREKFSTEAMRRGINHIELRMFDLNPLYPQLINPMDIYFANYLMLYFAAMEDFDFTEEMQLQAAKNHTDSALYDISSKYIGSSKMLDAAMGILEDIKLFFQNDEKAVFAIEYQQKKLSHNNRYCIKIREMLGNDFQHKMTELAAQYTFGNNVK